MKQNDSCRQEIRIEKDDKDDKNDIFTLSEEEFNSYFNQLQTSNIDLLNKIMNFFQGTIIVTNLNIMSKRI